MPRSFSRWLCATACVMASLGAALSAHAQAQPRPSAASAAVATTAAPAPVIGTPVDSPSAAAPAGFVAPEEPRAAETNAQRTRSQPGNNAPFWRGVHDSGSQSGVTNLPGAEMGVLVQQFVDYPGAARTNAGEAWRQVRNRWIIPYGGSLVVITVLALALFYFARGPIGGHVPDTGRRIERFTYFERAAHWINAIAFCLLAISGLVMAFGKFVLLPLTGGLLFGWLTYALKTLHNIAGPLFAVSLAVVFFVFVRDNWPSRVDLRWIAKGGGLFGGGEPSSGRFNAGEKLVFWGGVFALGIFVISSGLVLDQLIPGLAYLRGDMQIAHMVHSVAAVLMVVVFLGHMYLGSIGMRGSYQGMKTGYVDEGWAREHHDLWYDDIRTGKIPAQRSRPAGTLPIDAPGGPAAARS